MATAKVFAGICGFNTEIKAIPGEKYSVNLTMNSECPDVAKIADQFGTIHPLKEVIVKKNQQDTNFYKLFYQLPHAQCPVMVASIKAIEIALDLALPKDVHITLSRD